MPILTETPADNIDRAARDLVAELLDNAVHESISLGNKDGIERENGKAFFGRSKARVLHLMQDIVKT